MSNMITATVKIKGTRPLFQHRFGPDALPLEKGEKTGVAGNDPEEWRKTCMVTKDGQLFINGPYIFGAMREAAKYTKKGRATLVRPVQATLQVLTDRVLIDRFWPEYPNGDKFDAAKVKALGTDPDEPVYMDIRGVVNPSTRGRNIRYRIATSPGWHTEFQMTWDKTLINRDEMHAIMIDAGMLVGVGNGRAIGMGRFEVEAFDVAD